MRFIKPGYEIFDLPDATDKMGVLRHLERIGRVCYKSEDKITDESCIKYLEMIRDKKHWAMLEHYTFVVAVPEYVYDDFINIRNKVIDSNNPDLIHKMMFIRATKQKNDDTRDQWKDCLISGSATAFNYLWECEPVRELGFRRDGANGVIRFLIWLYEKFPEIMKHPYESKTKFEHVGRGVGSLYSNLEMHFLSREEIEELPVNLRFIHDTMSVKFTVNRGVTHELVRHRVASWAQESTRYVNYGKRGCTFIIPLWLDNHDKNVLLDEESLNDLCDGEFLYKKASEVYGLADDTIQYLLATKCVANVYESLLKMGWMPQQGRSVLVNDTKADIVMTANLYEWHHFFDMRAEEHAHIQMREVVCPLLNEVGLIGSRSDIFCNQREKYITGKNLELVGVNNETK